MAKITNPLHSITATGTVANTFTFRTQRGQAVVHHKMKSRILSSTTQQTRQAVYANICTLWNALDSGTKTYWGAIGKLTEITGFNAYCSDRLIAAYAPPAGPYTAELLGGAQTTQRIFAMAASLTLAATIPADCDYIIIIPTSNHYAGAPDITGVTIGGVQANLIAGTYSSVALDGMIQHVGGYALIAPPTGAVDVVASLAGNAYCQSITLLCFKNVDQVTPLNFIGDTVRESGSVSGCYVSGATTTYDLIVGLAACTCAASGMTADDTQLSEWHAGFADQTYNVQYSLGAGFNGHLTWTVYTPTTTGFTLRVRGAGQ
jgi:hypothetical protein